MRIVGRIDFVHFMSIIRRMNLIGFLNSMYVEVARLNHLIEFLLTKYRNSFIYYSIPGAMLKVKLIFAYVNYCKSISNN